MFFPGDVLIRIGNPDYREVVLAETSDSVFVAADDPQNPMAQVTRMPKTAATELFYLGEPSSLREEHRRIAAPPGNWGVHGDPRG